MFLFFFDSLSLIRKEMLPGSIVLLLWGFSEQGKELHNRGVDVVSIDIWSKFTC